MAKQPANRLAQESSPYLKQHAHNPVDWYPWGAEALKRAKTLNRPIFLSIGYSACHWCHVMERESFEEAETAALLNAEFVSIKVDREERPDLDHIYMAAVQAMTQRGGWPLSVFLTPDQKPFYGGTYFPPTDRHGLPSFKKILSGVANAWKTRPEEVGKSAGQLSAALDEVAVVSKSEVAGEMDYAVIREIAVASSLSNHDPEEGGFGSAPKFFHSTDLRILLRQFHEKGAVEALSSTTFTLNRWAGAGIRDHLGGGFHRYSTDREWKVPHFEKMLYDNALLVPLFLEAFQQTKDAEYSQVAASTLDFVIREMQSPEGGYYSTQDADSEGEEGKYYVWSKRQIDTILDPETSRIFCKAFSVTEKGNWEGTNVLHRTRRWSELATELGMETPWLEDTVAAASRKLFAVRGSRIKPHTDEKIIVSWNGLMLQAMAEGYRVLGDKRYLESAEKAAEFLWSKLWDSGKKRLAHTYKDGLATQTGFLDDYSALALGLMALYEANSNEELVKRSQLLLEVVTQHFYSASETDLYFTPDFHESLILRPREFQDGATPSATGLAIAAYVRFWKLTADEKSRAIGEGLLKRYRLLMEQVPMASAQMLLAFGELSQPSTEVIIADGDDAEGAEAMLEVARTGFHPYRQVRVSKTREAIGQKATAYVCHLQCFDPIQDAEELKSLLRGRP